VISIPAVPAEIFAGLSEVRVEPFPMKDPAVAVQDTFISPTISSFSVGVEVPIPTFPE
jgi:hypothetical protein